ncbi:MAG: metalloregulator ArsR/SmtB family transcription factor [Pseudomonadota bacterium]
MNDETALLALSALAQPTRLAVFRLLIHAGGKGVAAGEIAERVGARPNTLSTHLQALCAGTLIGRERVGRSIVYSANYDRVSDLLTYLLQDCCAGEAEICGPVIRAVASYSPAPEPSVGAS